MTRERAIEINKEIHAVLKDYANKNDINRELCDILIDNYIEILPDDIMKEFIFRNNTYKASNVCIDIKKSLFAAGEFFVAYKTPENVIDMIRLIIISIFFIKNAVEYPLNEYEICVIHYLHTNNGYNGIDEEKVVNDISKDTKNSISPEKIYDVITDLNNINVIIIENGKVYLAEHVYGRI